MRVYGVRVSVGDIKIGYMISPFEIRGNGWVKCRMTCIVTNDEDFDFYDPEKHGDDSYMSQIYTGRLRRNGTLEVFWERTSFICTFLYRLEKQAGLVGSEPEYLFIPTTAN